MAVLAVLLNRGYNVAVPEVDRGDDLFVVHDETGRLFRIQVKSATGKGKRRVSGAFNISLNQLRTPRMPDLHYVLVLSSFRAKSCSNCGRSRASATSPMKAAASCCTSHSAKTACCATASGWMNFARIGRYGRRWSIS